MQAILFIGIQATGKSTFYKTNFFNSHVRLSMDLLNTNPTAEERKKYIERARENTYGVVGYYFSSSIEEALKRNALRTGKMKFNDLEKRLRIYETAHDFCVPPNIYMVARIDGRGFTRLTKETHSFERPFDERFRNFMIETVKHVMTSRFKVVYGYTESDEISLLFDLNEDTFSRKLRKYNSILAGEASAKFSVLLGDIAAFDCRISQLLREEDAHRNAHRNALSAHCYWLLRKKGKTAIQATKEIEGKSTAHKNELLFEHGINFNDLPNWQKRGVGAYWESFDNLGRK